jgi:hypothetical protein
MTRPNNTLVIPEPDRTKFQVPVIRGHRDTGCPFRFATVTSEKKSYNCIGHDCAGFMEARFEHDGQTYMIWCCGAMPNKVWSIKP